MKKIEDFEFNDNFFNSYMKTIFGEAFAYTSSALEEAFKAKNDAEFELKKFISPENVYYASFLAKTSPGLYAERVKNVLDYLKYLGVPEKGFLIDETLNLYSPCINDYTTFIKGAVRPFRNNAELEKARSEGKLVGMPYEEETLIDKTRELCQLVTNMSTADMKAKSTKKGFLAAFDYALVLDDITVKDIIRIDSMVNYNEGISEGYKRVDNCIFGAEFKPCSKELVPIKMQELVHKYNTEWALDIPAFDFDMDFNTAEEKENAKEAYLRAFYEREAKFHIEFERIHPFEDGNGRTGRIITNAHLLHNHLAPVIITSSMKSIYLKCINDRDYQTLGNLFRMLASVTISQLIAYYRKVKGISPDDIGGKRGKPNK